LIFSFFYLWKNGNCLLIKFVWKSCALAPKILLWKLPMDESSTYENVVIGNNETIEICMNDEIMEKNVSV
jgi:hypothetical protein